MLISVKISLKLLKHNSDVSMPQLSILLYILLVVRFMTDFGSFFFFCCRKVLTNQNRTNQKSRKIAAFASIYTFARVEKYFFSLWEVYSNSKIFITFMLELKNIVCLNWEKLLKSLKIAKRKNLSNSPDRKSVELLNRA